MSSEALPVRVARAADSELSEKGHVAFLDVLVRMRWLEPVRVREWQQGRVPVLEGAAQVDPVKLSVAMDLFRNWATERTLEPSETAYVSRTRDRRVLQFSMSGDPATERAYRTHWVSPALPEAKRSQLADRQSRAPNWWSSTRSTTGPAASVRAAAIS